MTLFLLNADNLSGLNNFLKDKGWLKKEEMVLSATKPGEGNMNCVLRITTNIGSYIIKQSRGYVEKYPQVPAPAQRAKSEAAFYNCIKQHPELIKHTPQLLRTDTCNNILMLEDLGTASDYSYLYNGLEKITNEDAVALVNFLNHLHGSVIKNYDPLLRNDEMKKLNHEYIFMYPFMENNGLDLNSITPGLQDIAVEYQNDPTIKESASELGKIYLQEGEHLLHGDYYPGSWLKTNKGLQIIDPEFCFFGKAEFDVGVMLAHCYLSEQPQTIIDMISTGYKKNDHFNEKLLQQFTGIEIMRRLLGLAQLPLTATLETKKTLLKKGYSLLKS